MFLLAVALAYPAEPAFFARSGYKYELVEEISARSSIVGYSYQSACLSLDPTGVLTLRPGFGWDGPSVVPDGPRIIRASAFHDALYRLIRAQAFDSTARARRAADQLFARVAREDGFGAPGFARGMLRIFGGLGLVGGPVPGELVCRPASGAMVAD